MRKEVEAFTAMRYGMFVHYGLFSMLGRGEWVMNREQIAPSEMERLAQEFNPSKFDAEEICRLAVDGGMKYVVLTTMHHEGFRLYDTALTAFNAKAVCGRDLVEEFVSAARRHGLRIGLYHSLNNWHDQPDAVAALESEADYRLFMEHTFARIKELVTHFNPVDILWYDGWWPFDAEGWQAERMNEMVSAIQPHVIFNGRNCLPGDFGTPEQHLSVPDPWRPWEACMTLNDHWGFHISDEEWKSPACGREDASDLCQRKRKPAAEHRPARRRLDSGAFREDYPQGWRVACERRREAVTDNEDHEARTLLPQRGGTDGLGRYGGLFRCWRQFLLHHAVLSRKTVDVHGI